MSIANQYVDGMGRFTNPETLCETCMEAKFTRKSFNENKTRAGRPGYRTHADLIGPLNPAAMVTQGKYVLTVVDDFSRYATTYVMKTKRETTDRLVNYFKYLKTMFPEPGRIARLRTDGGTEFVNNRLKKFSEEQGITLEVAETEAHQHNGTVERFNRTLQNRIRALLESVEDRKGDAVRKLTEQEIKATETKTEYFKTRDIFIGDSESNYHRLNEVDNGAAAPTGGGC